MELTAIQRLAVAEAFSKAVKEATNPRGGSHGAPTLRTEADDALREDFERDGTDRRRIVINGVEVGTLSARVSKPERGVRVKVQNPSDFARWLLYTDDGRSTIFEIATKSVKLRDEVLEVATRDGVLPDGCVVEDYDKPAQWLGTTLRVSVPKVGEAMGAELPEAVSGLLGGGGE